MLSGRHQFFPVNSKLAFCTTCHAFGAFLIDFISNPLATMRFTRRAMYPLHQQHFQLISTLARSAQGFLHEELWLRRREQ
jgi:hypothetical protein